MNYSYVLIQDETNNRNWYMILREYSEEAVIKAVGLWKESAISQMLNGRKGLTLELIEKMTWKCIDDTIHWLNEGRTLLVNRNGGHMFLMDTHVIIKEVKNYTFPISDNDFINGLLSPEGVFIPCEYGHHCEIAQNIEDDSNLYISISHDPIGDNSAIFIGCSVTEAQKKFLISNLERLDHIHIKTLKNKKIIRPNQKEVILN